MVVPVRMVSVSIVMVAMMVTVVIGCWWRWYRCGW